MIHVISKVQLLILRNQYDRGHLDSWDFGGKFSLHYYIPDIPKNEPFGSKWASKSPKLGEIRLSIFGASDEISYAWWSKPTRFLKNQNWNSHSFPHFKNSGEFNRITPRHAPKSKEVENMPTTGSNWIWSITYWSQFRWFEAHLEPKGSFFGMSGPPEIFAPKNPIP